MDPYSSLTKDNERLIQCSQMRFSLPKMLQLPIKKCSDCKRNINVRKDLKTESSKEIVTKKDKSELKICLIEENRFRSELKEDYR